MMEKVRESPGKTDVERDAAYTDARGTRLDQPNTTMWIQILRTQVMGHLY